MRRGVGGTGDHAVGEAELHHHGAEVGDIGDRVESEVERDALVGADALVLLREALAQLRIEGAHHGRGFDVEPEIAGPTAHLALLSEDGQARHLALQHGGRGAQDAVVAALGQHDVPLGAAARSSSPYSNISGVTTSALLTSSSFSSCAPSTYCSKRPRALSYFTLESAASRPRVEVMRTAVS